MSDNNNLQGKCYLITGASQGFGLAISTALLERGANVAMLARRAEKLQQARDALTKKYAEKSIFTQCCDVQQEAQIEAAFNAAKEHFGQLNGIINNAGVARPDKIENINSEELMLQVQTNLIGTILGCKAAVKLLRGEDNPRIINISSASARHNDEIAHLSVYAASKAAIERFSRDLRTELQCDGIAVSCIRPGGAWTDFANDWNSEKLAEAMASWKQSGPTMDSGMEPSDVAEAVCHALSYPAGVAIDLLEVRPNRPMEKIG